MSSKIYFGKNRRFSLKRGAVSVASKLYYKVAPKHALKTARKLFLTPAKGREINPMPEAMRVETVETLEGKMMTYQLGAGPTWVLTHGWSGSANQFFPLMEFIAESGYTALAYDHPAHGKSEGKEGSIPAFLNALEGILNRQEHIEGVIAHSMGGATVLESEHLCLKGKPIILVAPVLNYWENLFATVKASGFSMKLFKEVIDDVGRQYDVTIESFDPFKKLALRQGPITIVHDKGDRFAPFSVSEEATQFAHVSLVATEGLGHGRVLKSAPLKEAFCQATKRV
ncbi:alpha/beta hydrolase [Enterovibrio nigricans]|uniref:Alpha/beta hydrolase family protein n=1 Tax=Enterovibrio nigricans DSM 22720 TaxID=1121868 RepID=A0A1T4VAZ0_9GAMM|nr:alpha/beta fold hydrolase [Enterovibrio nigricans]PKF49931.1 alpha/beta hydrolase [Enterovibrio nigricans]SKA62063.1 Alpha/beta hydrolase family protein [Enterovibrio nigricans DSM 22720]